VAVLRRSQEGLAPPLGTWSADAGPLPPPLGTRQADAGLASLAAPYGCLRYRTSVAYAITLLR